MSSRWRADVFERVTCNALVEASPEPNLWLRNPLMIKVVNVAVIMSLNRHSEDDLAALWTQLGCPHGVSDDDDADEFERRRQAVTEVLAPRILAMVRRQVAEGPDG